MTELLSLPDDALLAVLAFLPPRQLFACRVACRRLRDLCLHPELWVKARVEKKGLLRAALSLAPCIGFASGSGLPMAAIVPLVSSSECVVAGLSLTIQEPRDEALATAVVLKLSARGGLRKLHLRNSYFRKTSTPLLEAVCCIKGLQELVVLGFFDSEDPLPPTWCELGMKPSLTKLVIECFTANPFLELLLRTHATTLEDVELPRLEKVPASLLARIPKLRSLKCYPSNDLCQLVALPNLDTIIFPDFTSRLDAFPPGALDLLRGNIRTVRFACFSESVDAFLRAVGESRSALVAETLDWPLATLSTLELLIPALPNFPNMKTLNLRRVVPDAFLHAVSPSSLPSLTSLTVFFPLACPCIHVWLHQPAIQDLLARNPRLHLRVGSMFPVKTVSCNNSSCLWCRRNCHRPLQWLNWRELLFSSHSKRAGCPTNCFQVANAM